MSLLKMLQSLPPGEEISPEMERKLKSAANMLLAGREGGHANRIGPSDRSVGYGDYDGLANLTEPQIIERESLETQGAESTLEICEYHNDYSDNELCKPRYVMLNFDEAPFFEGSRRQVEQVQTRLEMTRVKEGLKAMKKEMKKLRETYLKQKMGDFYEKGP